MAEENATVDQKDVQDNKVFAILAYLGILFLIPLLAAKDSPFAKFHTNQGIILFIVSIIVWVLVMVLYRVSFGLGALFSTVLYIGIAVFAIIGIINAAKGEKKELPIIGKYTILK
ncbi:MAG: hypothetical protein LBR84_05650 [Tannerella sp.]|jgi:uncharacterized membrane protein|nr:hypothetical protein [Tannerella sp.]